jgi:pimeloyl-ACP methyl ester carboxylesterase
MRRVLVPAGGVWLYYRWWQQRRIGKLSARSSIIDTRLGPVEYAFRGEHGPVVVMMHGLPGGFDQGLAVAGWLSAAPCRFLSISRPGYLRTPLSSGHTPDEQADLISAVLDSMSLPNAAVLGLSAGGPSAVRFAIRHPNRCWALVLASAVGVRIEPRIPPDHPAIKLAMPPAGFLMWVSNALFHTHLRFASSILTMQEIETLRGNGDRQAFLEIADTYIPLRHRAPGMINDARHFAELPEFVPPGVHCPTVVVHGDADEIVPFHHALAYLDAIPHAEFVLLENGSHLAGVARRREVSARVVDFLAGHVNQPATLKP